MEYEEAFKKLGYSLPNNRQDWSAEKPDGICITVWTQLTRINPATRMIYYDCWENWPNTAHERNPAPGNTKLIAHLTSAINKFDGRVDAILVSGDPGVGYGTADPWFKTKRKGFWKITKFCDQTGFFRAEVFPTI